MEGRKFILSIDQGTTSTRVSIMNENLHIVYNVQQKQDNIYQHPGWCETDPNELYSTVKQLCNQAITEFHNKKIETSAKIITIGITNQRETCLVWDRQTGKAITNAILWNDTRTKDLAEALIKFNNGNRDEYQKITGLPISTYFSGLKFKWMIENNKELKEMLNNQYQSLCFGTIDSWILYNLTQGKVFATDVTNASRTMLMNINTLSWDVKMSNIFDVPIECLPEILSSSDDFGRSDDLLESININGIIGDQQAACLGHCLMENEVKNTYGTGGFLLMNIKNNLFFSKTGLLTTVLYKNKTETQAIYALEGAIEVAGNALTWLNENLNLFSDFNELSDLFNSVENNGGVYFVPCFSGLFSPYWDNSAKAALFGLTNNTKKGHILRATFEAISLRTLEIIECFEKETNLKVSLLKVDGGLTNSDEFLQTQANILKGTVKTMNEKEITSLGAAICGGIGSGLYESIHDVSKLIKEGKSYHPKWSSKEHDLCLKYWKKAIERSRNWEDL